NPYPEPFLVDPSIDSYLKASDPELESKELEALALSPDHKVRRRVAEHPKATPDLLHKLAKDGKSSVKLEAVRNKKAPLPALDKVAHDENPSVRYGVADDPTMPEEVLVDLTEDENPYVSVRAQKTLRDVRSEAARSIHEKRRSRGKTRKPVTLQIMNRY